MKKRLTWIALLGAFAIVLGAFGAHGLKDKISAESLESYETGVKYLIYHVLVLLFLNTYSGFNVQIKKRLSLLFFIGLLFFSGSIFCISLGIVSAKSIWFITPLGGLLLIGGWLLMAYHFAESKEKNT
ncbi:DUF423 domain-containing protein [Namhaeicola litoreus]|uniref:DUF423 domain-containing protein n=1 Tax=Namhaeicola litoreus TaxID=1052145 RepID=A0ABW3XXQ8_9FLAO